MAINQVEWYRQEYTGRKTKFHWFPTRHEGDGSTYPVCGANIIAEVMYGDKGIVFLEQMCRRCMKKAREAELGEPTKEE